MNDAHKSFLHKTHSKLYNEQHKLYSDSKDFLKGNLENKLYFVFILWFLCLNL